MRFQDWDVLLFSDASCAPLQEFRTACFLVQQGTERESPASHVYVLLTMYRRPSDAHSGDICAIKPIRNAI